MSNKFTVINSTKEDKNSEKNRINKVIKMSELWGRQYNSFVLQVAEKNKDIMITDCPQVDLMKIAFSGIKYICSWRDIKRESERIKMGNQQSLEDTQNTLQLIDLIFMFCGCLTLRNFVITFPIEKKYDGAKCGWKDYFYTMDILSKMDWDKPIGRDELSELLWDYENTDLRHAYVEYTTAASAIYRAQTGKGIAEKFCEDHGIATYTIDNETGIVKNNQTGDITKVNKTSHLQIVK